MARTAEMKLLELMVLKNDISSVIEYIGKKENFQFQTRMKETAAGSDTETAASDEVLNIDTQFYDGLEKAAAELALAVEELKALGVNVSTSNPIHIDLPCAIFSAGWTNRAQTYKQSMERALGGLVVLDLPTCENADEFYGCGYDTETGDQANYDIYNLSGWGPDYGDPQTYLDTFLPDGAGYMAKCIGLF